MAILFSATVTAQGAVRLDVVPRLNPTTARSRVDTGWLQRHRPVVRPPVKALLHIEYTGQLQGFCWGGAPAAADHW